MKDWWKNSYSIHRAMTGMINRQNMTGVSIADVYACGKNGEWYYFNYAHRAPMAFPGQW